ncbi:hypothetical protein E2320_000639 [Naja naja]|nr:hypothetical protein E2320_000639 [Naja naja]
MIALCFAIVFCSFISLLCLFIALGSEYWLGDSIAHAGLWKICNHEVCQSLGVELVSASLQATRTFMLLGMIAGAVSLIGLCIMNIQPRLAYMANFTAGLCVMIAMSIFSGEHGTASNYGWSFGVGWASVPFYLLNVMNFNNIKLMLSSSSLPVLLASGRPVHPTEMSALHFAAVFCSFISLLCLLAALGSDYWVADSSSHMGLWKICNHGGCQSFGVEWVSGKIQYSKCITSVKSSGTSTLNSYLVSALAPYSLFTCRPNLHVSGDDCRSCLSWWALHHG